MSVTALPVLPGGVGLVPGGSSPGCGLPEAGTAEAGSLRGQVKALEPGWDPGSARPPDPPRQVLLGSSASLSVEWA